MRVVLLRHGATALNEARRYQGRIDEPLSEAGRSALRASALRPRIVQVSPLRRARETASLLFPEARQVVVEALTEMDFGDFDGRSADEMADDAAYRAWVEAGCEPAPPGGESLAAFKERVVAAVGELVDNAAGADDETLSSGPLIIVAHGGTIMAALERFAEPRREYFEWAAPLGCGFELETDAELWRACCTLELVRSLSFVDGDPFLGMGGC